MPEIIPLTQTTVRTANTMQPSAKALSPETPIAPVQATQEAAPQEPPKEVKKEEPDPRFIALSKKEKELLRMRQEIQKEREMLQNKYKSYEELEALKSDKLKLLEKLGVSYDDHTNLVLGQQNLTPEQIAQMKAEEIVKRELEVYKQAEQQRQAEQQQQAYDNALQQIAYEAEEFCNKSNDFPLVKEEKAYDTVKELIRQTFDETGKIISVEQAVSEVEQHLMEETLRRAKHDKIRSQLLKDEQPKIEQVKEPELITKPQTLTHRTTVSPSVSSPKNETYEQKKQRLIQKYSGRAV